jgi:hypothetical protein
MSQLLDFNGEHRSARTSTQSTKPVGLWQRVWRAILATSTGF